MEVIITVTYLGSMTLILVFSLVQFDLAIQYIRSKKGRAEKPQPALKPGEYPQVTIQLPVYNEKYVVRRLLESVTALEYPKDKFEIQVLDDSTDETSRIIRETMEEMVKKGINITLHHRTKREGYKAGALLDGFKKSAGEFIAIFDADFIPEKDFLLKTLPHFRDPAIGLVQTRWGHVNEKYSLLTRLQAFGLNAHFTVEQVGRSAAGSYINFNGTAGIWRKQCILDGGNWAMDMLSEDLDLSYRSQLKGWKFKYLENVVSPAELPVVIQAIRSQQFRWTKGGAEAARKNLGRVLSSSLKLKNKIHAVFHLLNSTVFPLLLLAAITSIPLLLIKQNKPVYSLFFDLGFIFFIGFLGLSVFYWVSARYFHPDKTLKYYLFHYPLFLAFSMGLSFQNTVAVLEGLFGVRTEFVRTPKFNIQTKKDTLKNKIYIESRVTWQNLIEFFLFLYFLAGVVLGIFFGDYVLVIFHLMLAFGFAGVTYYSLKPLKINA
ncbi:MAG: glycosyltransferase family 2 protein [Cyclobacteriaceae bacterium]|nr:glycosyltransferase family 2 protein [Cyclobacteriaceae bacterium]